LSSAFALTQRDTSLKIVIVGPKHRPQSASMAAGAMLNLFGEVTTATLSSKYGREKFKLSYLAKQRWPAWIESIQSRSNDLKIQSAKGTMIILNSSSDSMDDANFSATLSALEQYGEKYELIDPSHISGLNPDPQKRALRAAFIPEEHAIDVQKLVDGLTKALDLTKQVDWIDSSVDKLSGNQPYTIEFKNDLLLSASKVLVAAGAESQFILDTLDVLKYSVPPMLYGVGTALVVQTQEANQFDYVIRTPNRGLACGIHAVPQLSGELYIGASNYISPYPNTRTSLTSSYFLLKSAMEQLDTNYCKAEIAKWCSGYRPITIDTFPLIGATGCEGVYVLSGTYRDGIFNSPLYADLISREILEEECLLNHSFAPQRKPLETMTQEESISSAIKHYFSAAYMHDLQMPKMGVNALFESMLHQIFEETYAELGITQAVPPEILVMYSRHRGEYLNHLKQYYR
jgi:glycine oxidase